VQQAIVFIAVILATLVSVWKLMPARRRLLALVSLERMLARQRWLPGFRERVLQRKIQAAAGSGCAGCAANVGTRPNHPPR
jgi:hypothetical protein